MNKRDKEQVIARIQNVIENEEILMKELIEYSRLKLKYAKQFKEMLER